MPKINKLKRTRALKAQKMNEMRKAKKTNEEDAISTVPNKNVKCAEATQQLDIDNAEMQTATAECVYSENVPLQSVPSSSSQLLQSSFQISNLVEIIESDEDINLEIEPESTVPPPLIIGRRIIDINHFYHEVQKISNHGPLNCDLSCIDIVGEKQIGLRSKFTLLCKLCKKKFYIENEPPDDLDINRRAVAGTIVIGCGHSQLEELSAALDLPLMSSKIYQESHNELSKQWEKIALETMNTAAEAERNIAIAEGRVDKNNIPIIDVIVDGCWSKRTYKKNYAALSGAAAIIGKKTGQILFLGVKNKYCCICSSAEKKNNNPKEHICYKNYSGSSTGMESTILVEGFKASIDMHNLIYGRMVEHT